MSRFTTFRAPALALVGLLSLISGCAGGLHTEGQHQLRVVGTYGHPVPGDNIWPQGEGDADNGGVTIDYGYFVRDRLALLAAVSPYRQYSQSSGDVFAAELQIGLRYYFWEFDLGPVPIGLYGEALGGLMYGSESIPEHGSHANFTQDTGVGFEALLTESISWVGGWRFRHLSNGRLFRDRNPGQNDNAFYTGVAITFD